MDIEHVEFLAVYNSKEKIVGVFTMGGFRRYVLRGLDINEKILINNFEFQSFPNFFEIFEQFRKNI